MQAQNRANTKKRETERKQILYILLHTYLEWRTRDAPRKGECKEAPPGPPSLYIFTWGVARYIASQLYPETLSLNL